MITPSAADKRVARLLPNGLGRLSLVFGVAGLVGSIMPFRGLDYHSGNCLSNCRAYQAWTRKSGMHRNALLQRNRLGRINNDPGICANKPREIDNRKPRAPVCSSQFSIGQRKVDEADKN